MKIQSFEILDYSFPELRLRLAVGSGTYIRSIGYRLGQESGLGGILTSLRRISLGEWHLEESLSHRSSIRERKEVDYHMRGQVGNFRWGVIEE